MGRGRQTPKKQTKWMGANVATSIALAANGSTVLILPDVYHPTLPIAILRIEVVATDASGTTTAGSTVSCGTIASTQFFAAHVISASLAQGDRQTATLLNLSQLAKARGGSILPAATAFRVANTSGGTTGNYQISVTWKVLDDRTL